MYLGGERVRRALRAVIAVFWDVVVLPLPPHLYASIVYSTLQHRRCATCGVRLTGNNHRPCPKPDAISGREQGLRGEYAVRIKFACHVINPILLF